MHFIFPMTMSLVRQLYCIFLLALCAQGFAFASGIQVSLKSDVMVDGPRVLLADLATIESAVNTHGVKEKSATIQALAMIDLGASPLPGYTGRYTRKEIERLVRSSGINRSVAWLGADVVRIERNATTFDTSKIVDRASSFLRDLLRDEANRVDLQLSGALPDVLLPRGTVELKPRAMQAAQALHRNVTVWIDVMIDGVFVRSVTVPFHVQAYRPVLVAKRDLPKGTVPTCDTLAVREENVAALEGTPLAANCALVAGNLKRTLLLGMPLLKPYLQTPVAVAQGESVSLQLIAGAVMLESRAVALVDGEVGQRINVRPSASTDTIMAEVIAPGVVKVIGQ